jgi:hypothetical protein
VDNNLKINIAVSANKRFLHKTYETCIGSLIKSGINSSNIYIFIGNDGIEPKIVFENIYNVNLIYLKNNYFEANCFLGILENKMDDCDYWFVMHDTCMVGGNFAKKLSAYDYINKPYVALWKYHGCGCIGAYKFEIIQKYSDIFNTLYKYDNKDQNKIKEVCVLNEDIIFRYGKPWSEINTFDFYYDTEINTEPMVNIFGTKRLKEICPYLELSKFKANYSGLQPLFEIKDLE